MSLRGAPQNAGSLAMTIINIIRTYALKKYFSGQLAKISYF